MAAEFTATTSTAGGGNFRVQHRPPCRPRLAAPAAAFTPGCWAVRRRHYPPEQRRRVPGAAARQEPSAASTAEAAKPSKQKDQQGAAHPPAQPPPSRLQQEVQLLVALDVEYAHLRLAPGGRHVSLPAEVCAVDAEGRVLLYEHCNPLGQLPEQQRRRWRHVGGAPPALWQHAAPLSEVRQRLAALLQGRILVGHHLRKDLAALALSHPAEATRDTLQYRELQGRRGSGRKLADLSAERLGRRIQAPGRRHSPREDAQAAMDLYLREVHFQERYMAYDDLVERHLAEILGTASLGSGSDEATAAADAAGSTGSSSPDAGGSALGGSCGGDGGSS
ncbi:hypothetical protein ABPG77_004959 [Micractinium sp. CCAP 211/92]